MNSFNYESNFFSVVCVGREGGGLVGGGGDWSKFFSL